MTNETPDTPDPAVNVEQADTVNVDAPGSDDSADAGDEGGSDE